MAHEILISVGELEELSAKLQSTINCIDDTGKKAVKAANALKNECDALTMFLVPSLSKVKEQYIKGLSKSVNTLNVAIDMYKGIDRGLKNKADEIDTSLIDSLQVISNEKKRALENSNHTDEMKNAILNDRYDLRYLSNGNAYLTLPINMNNLQTQGSKMCTAYSWAFGMSMVYPEKTFSPDSYWGEGGCSFSGSSQVYGYNAPSVDSSEQYLLSCAYNELINNGKPCVIYAEHENASGGLSPHAVTVIGINPNADPNNLKTSDFLVYDPSSAANNDNHIWTMDNVKYTNFRTDYARFFKYV